MITQIKRLSDLAILNKLITEGKTIVASGKSNYKINLSQIKGRQIIGINQLGDGNDRLNSIRIDYDTGESQYLYFYNGTVGDTGEKGDKGPQGEKGHSFNQSEVQNRADGVLEIVNDDVTNDREKVWSAYRGKVLEEFLKSISQIIMNDDEYQLRFNEQVFIDLEFNTKNPNKDSLIIYNDNAKYKSYVKYWTYEGEAGSTYFFVDPESGEYVEASSSFDIWKDYYLAEYEKDYYTRHLQTTIINEDTGESTSEWVYDKISLPVWMELEFETKTEDRNSIILYSDKELGDDGVADKDPKEEEIVILHKPITSIIIDSPNFTLPINSIITKAINILPTDYLNSPICIEYDENMIKVFEDGRIMALENSGQTTVKVYSQENPEIYDIMNINVVIPVIDIKFDSTSIKAFKGYAQQINATVLPEDATNPVLEWISSDPEIAEVDQTGMITLIKEGSVTIYAKSTDGTNISSRVDVTVDTAVETIDIMNTNKLIIANINDVIEFTNLNELIGEDLVNDSSVLSASNTNINVNNRIKKITLASMGNSALYIDNGTTRNKVNIIVGDNMDEPIVKDCIEVLVGHSTTLQANVGPENASNKELTWQLRLPGSSPLAIAKEQNKIDATVFMSNKATVDLIVTPDDQSNVKSYVTLVGVIPIKEIELNENKISLDLGETYQLEATINEDAEYPQIIWSSNSPSIVSVDETGYVKSLSGGDAIITATAGDGSGVIARCIVSSVVLITSISINNGNDIDIYAGNEYMINYSIEPENAYNQTLIWYTSDEDIAEVTNGRLVAKKEGKVKVYAMADDNSGVITSINVNVSIPTKVLSLSNTELTLQVNENYSLIATVSPDDTTNQNVIFESVDPSIAYIDNNGNITAIKEGETEIFVSTTDGSNLSQKCTVNIIN